MDNLSSHNVNAVRQRIQAVGAELLYMPPYSPDLKPLRKHGPKLKEELRSLQRKIDARSDHAVALLIPNIRRRMQRLGSEFPSELYTNNKSALVS